MSMTVEQVMSVELVTLSPNHWVYHAMDLMDVHPLRHLPIVDEERCLRGVISDRDVKKLTHANFNTEEESAQERLSLLEEVGVVAHQEPLTVSPDTELSEVAELMLKHVLANVQKWRGDRLKVLMFTKVYPQSRGFDRAVAWSGALRQRP